MVLGSWFLVLGSWFLVLGSWFLVLGSWFLLLRYRTRETRQVGRDKPRRGGAHGCAPFPEAQDAPYGNSRPTCKPNGFIVGRGVGCAFFGYFLCTSKESDSRKARKLFARPRAKSKAPLLNPPLRCAQGRRPEQKQGQSISKAETRQEQKQDQDGSQLALG